MTELQNPFEFVGAQAPPAEEGAAPMPPESPRGAAPISDSDDMSCIGEIFVGARKLESFSHDLDPDVDPAAYDQTDALLYDVLKAADDPRLPGLAKIPDEQALFDAIEPPPLFLQERVA